MAGFFDKLRQGLSKTGSGIAAIFTGSGIDDEFYEELEEALIMADVGMATTDKLLSGLRDAVAEKKIKERSEARKELISLLADLMRPEKPFLDGANRAVIMVVGVNGVGKTTSLGKIAAYYKNQGRDVVLAAADTFRAAAAEQLTVWAERAGVPVEALMVLDATTGQNAIAQARAFGESAGLTGIILTKLDGTAKGGVAVAVKEELKIPVRFVGVGEGIDDMQAFDPDDYARALLSEE